MSLKERIKEDMKAAMRAKDSVRLESIRMLLAAIQRREVDERIALDDTQTLAVIEKLVKQGAEAAAQFTQGGRADLADKENATIALYRGYLPEPLSEAEIDRLIAAAVAESGAASLKDMGKVVGLLKAKVQGRADMGQISAKVKAALAAKV